MNRGRHFLKQVADEIIATIKPTLVLLISLVLWVVNKITQLPKFIHHTQSIQLFKIFYIPILFLLSISLCVYLNFFTIAFFNGQRPWQSLGIPSDIPDEIVMANHTEILVKTAMGKYFICTFRQDDHLTLSVPVTSCWQETDEMSLHSSGSYILETSKNKLSWWVKKPGKVIDSMSIAITFEDAGYIRRNIIDNKGEVWLGDEIPWSAYDPLVGILLVSGIIGGIVLSTTLLFFRRRFEKRKGSFINAADRQLS